MSYTIQTVETKPTKTGKTYKILHLTSDDGFDLEGVKCWGNFPHYADLVAGYKVEGEIKEDKFGKVLEAKFATPNATRGNSGAYRAGQIEKAQATKQTYIRESQDAKFESIKVSSTMRDAVLCAIAEYQKKTNDLSSLEELILKWREWLWNNFDVESDKYPPF